MTLRTLMRRFNRPSNQSQPTRQELVSQANLIFPEFRQQEGWQILRHLATLKISSLVQQLRNNVARGEDASLLEGQAEGIEWLLNEVDYLSKSKIK